MGRQGNERWRQCASIEVGCQEERNWSEKAEKWYAIYSIATTTHRLQYSTSQIIESKHFYNGTNYYLNVSYIKQKEREKNDQREKNHYDVSPIFCLTFYSTHLFPFVCDFMWLVNIHKTFYAHSLSAHSQAFHRCVYPWTLELCIVYICVCVCVSVSGIYVYIFIFICISQCCIQRFSVSGYFYFISALSI